MKVKKPKGKNSGVGLMSEAALSPDSATTSSRAWLAWGMLKQEILYICWALMEIALLAPFALFVMRWARFWPGRTNFIMVALLDATTLPI